MLTETEAESPCVRAEPRDPTLRGCAGGSGGASNRARGELPRWGPVLRDQEDDTMVIHKKRGPIFYLLAQVKTFRNADWFLPP